MKVFSYAGEELKTIEGHPKRINAVDYSADGTLIMSGSSGSFVYSCLQFSLRNVDNSLKIWNALTYDELVTLSGHKDNVFCCAFSHDARYAASGSCDKSILLWNTESGEEVGILNGHTDWVTAIAFSAYSRHLVSGSQDTTLKVFYLKFNFKLKVF